MRGLDFIVGMSGGIESSYLTHIAKEKLGLRPVVFHVDAGWNSQVAVNNIESLVDGYFLFKGKYRAVLINYPSRADKDVLCRHSQVEVTL